MSSLKNVVSKRNRQLQARLDQSLSLDTAKQTEFAATALAIGCSLVQATESLAVVFGQPCPSRAALGRWTKAVANKCQGSLIFEVG